MNESLGNVLLLSAYTALIRLRLLPLQCLLSSLYQMSSCSQRAGTAYRCVHEGTVMERHPLAANTDLRQHPARLPDRYVLITMQEADMSSMQQIHMLTHELNMKAQ